MATGQRAELRWCYLGWAGIYTVAHPPEHAILYVTFSWVLSCAYAGVSVRTYRQLLASGCAERFFQARIVDRYPGCRL